MILRKDVSNSISQSSVTNASNNQVQTIKFKLRDEFEDDYDESDVNTPFHFKPDIKYYQVSGQYSIEFLQCIENNPFKIDSFYEYVIPCLAYQVYYKNENKNKYMCMFSACRCVNKTFSKKSTYIKHVVSTHYNDLPGGGAFLMPRAKKFKCNMCKMDLIGKDMFLGHANKCTGGEYCADLDEDESYESSTSNSPSSGRATKGLKRDLSSYSVCGAEEKKLKENGSDQDVSMDNSY